VRLNKPVVGITVPGTSTSGGILALLGLVPSRPRVALTFDDGPNANGNTVQVLDVLRRHGVNATFFEVGANVAARPDLTRAVVADGNTVQNHTYHHPHLTRIGADAVGWEIDATNQAIQSATGRSPTCVRPPYGDTNATVQRVIASRGMTQQWWTVDTSDYLDPPAPAIVSRVLGGVRPGGVVLLHDGGGDRSQTVAALPAIIGGLIAAGYELVPVCQ